LRTRVTISLALSALALCILAGSAAADGPVLGPARSVALPPQGVSDATIRDQAAAGATVSSFAASIKSPLDGKTYTYRMVGKNPQVKQTTPGTNVATDVIPVALHFLDSGHTFNPNAKAPAACLPANQTADSLTLNSPLFKSHAYTWLGHAMGTGQYVDEFQRANFAKYTVNTGAINPAYHVVLAPVTNHALITVNVPTSAGVTVNAGCDGFFGEMSINFWDSVAQSKLKALAASIPATHFPLFVFYNVVMFDSGGCCIIGYHSAFTNTSASNAIETYGNSDYVTPGVFTNLNDIGAMSHEVGEWMDDPFVNNATPAWGHIGQVSGCQGNLEVGDPLSGTTPYSIAMPNGVTYHAQELAFRDWFYRTPSVGLAGRFSNLGHFTHNAGALCT
jgi:hypothetical protein